MKDNNKTVWLFVALLFVIPTVFAADPPPPTPPPGLPIDGGVLALLVAGLFYGVKKSFKKK